jgi:hypothetical protein
MSCEISPPILGYLEFLEETGRTERRYLTEDELGQLANWVCDEDLSLHLDWQNHSPAQGLCFEVCLTPEEADIVDEGCEVLALGGE